MLKFILFFLVFITSFSMDTFNINKLNTEKKDHVIYATLKSLNNAGFKIEKNDNSYTVFTDIGSYTLGKNFIKARSKSYSYISSFYEKNSLSYIPLNIILDLNSYNLDEKSNLISKVIEPKSPKTFPKKVISLSPGVTEKIFAMGGESLLIGRTKYSTFPKEVDKIDVVGSMFEPNLELIVDKKADLVLAETHFKDKLISTLNEFNIKTVKFYTAKNLDDIYSSILKIGVLINRPLEARSLNASLKDKVQFTKHTLEGVKSPNVYYVLSSGKSDITAGGDNFINSIMNLSGGHNIASNKKGWGYSLEELVLNDPQLVFGSERAINEMVKNENYQTLSAIKNKNYHIIKNTDVFNLPGPRAITMGTYEMVKIFHPELAKKLEIIIK